MKVLALIVLCAFAAVQARSTAVQNVRTEAALGDAPWLVHLRVAVITSGLLNTCAGSLINESWILTTNSCVENVRFIWVRYGVLNVVNPSLVTETSAVRNHPDVNLALISINRVVEFSDAIAPVSFSSTKVSTLPESATFCGFGGSEAGPGEILNCYTLAVEDQGDGLISTTSEDGAAATSFDDGAPLVSDGVQYGVLVSSAEGDSADTFLAVADHLEWIEQNTASTFRK